MRISDWSSDVCSSDLRARNAFIGDNADLTKKERGESAFRDDNKLDSPGPPPLGLATIADIDPADRPMLWRCWPLAVGFRPQPDRRRAIDRKSTRLKSSH